MHIVELGFVNARLSGTQHLAQQRAWLGSEARIARLSEGHCLAWQNGIGNARPSNTHRLAQQRAWPGSATGIAQPNGKHRLAQRRQRLAQRHALPGSAASMALLSNGIARLDVKHRSV